MPRVRCTDCGKPFVASGKNVVVCPACVDKRLAKPAPKARKRRPKPVPPAAPVTHETAPEAAVPPVLVAAPAAEPALDTRAPDKAALDALGAELAQAKADLMDANAEATRLWREKRAVEERLRKAELRLKMLKAQEVVQ